MGRTLFSEIAHLLSAVAISPWGPLRYIDRRERFVTVPTNLKVDKPVLRLFPVHVSIKIDRRYDTTPS